MDFPLRVLSGMDWYRFFMCQVSRLRSVMKYKDLGIWEDLFSAQIHPVWLLNLGLSSWKPFNRSEITRLKWGFNKQKGGSAEKATAFLFWKPKI